MTKTSESRLLWWLHLSSTRAFQIYNSFELWKQTSLSYPPGSNKRGAGSTTRQAADDPVSQWNITCCCWRPANRLNGDLICHLFSLEIRHCWRGRQQQRVVDSNTQLPAADPGKPKYSFSAFPKPAGLRKGIVIIIKAFGYIVSRKMTRKKITL